MQVELQKCLISLEQAACPHVPQAICSDQPSCYINKVYVSKTEMVPVITKIMTLLQFSL